MSPFGHDASCTCGAGALFGGCHAHQSFAAAHVSCFVTTFAAPSRGSDAPICTHFSKSLITSSGSFPPAFFGGIATSLFS